MNYKYKKNGISLIVLIITIIVIIILAGGVILSLSANNPINSANEAVFKSDLDAIESDLSLYLASQYTAVRAFNPDQLNSNDLTTEYNGTVIAGKTIKDIIPALSTTSKYNGQFEVVNGKLVYLGTDRTKKKWAQEVNVDVVDADRLDAIISTTTTLPISAGTDVVTTIKISSNASINNINLISKLELLDKNNVLVPVQPVFEIAAPTGTELDTLRTVDVKIKTDTLAEGIYKLRLKANCISNIYDVTNSVDIISSELFEIDNTPPTNPEMSVTPTGWTNLNVTISITYPSDSVAKEYSTDGSTWNVYTDSITVSNNNETIYARATDVAGNQSSQSTITIANIDRESPTVTYGTNGGGNLQVASTTVTVNDIGVSGTDLSSLRYIWDAQNVNEPTGEWTSFVNGEAISKLNSNGTYYLWIKAIDNTGNSVVTKSNAFMMDNTAPTNPTMSANPTGWTNVDVTVTITYSVDTTIKEFSTDGTTWNTYTSGVIVTTNNTTVYARGTDASGNQSSQSTLTVANIDKIIPTVVYGTNGGANLQTASTTVTASDLGGSNIASLQYVWDTQNSTTPSSGWVTFTNGSAITKTGVTGTYYLWVKAIDNAGNTYITKSNAFGTDVTPPINPAMSASPTGWTNGNVTVTITYPADAVIKEYSTDGTIWSTYISGVIVTTNNTTVYARGTDASGNQSGQSTLTVANIDKISPTIVYGTNGGTNIQTASTTVTAGDLGGSNIASVQYFWDTQNATTPSSGWITFTNGSTITKTGVTGTYYLWVKAIDNAGNTYITKSNAFGTDVTPPINPAMSASPTGWTNGNVTVTITYPADAVIKEYSTNGATWNSYTSGVIVTINNTTVYARGTDAAGNQSGQSTITVANIDKDIPNITRAISGTSLYTDPSFASGINSTYVYNNLQNGVVTNTRVAMSDSPTGSGYGLMIKSTAEAAPGWGGFYFATPTASGKVFTTKIIAKIPVGYYINWGSNLFGNEGTIMWLTSQAGTGNWQEYVCLVTCGTTGSFSTTNFYYLTGGTTPTSASPLIWNVAYATVFDSTKWGTPGGVMVSATDSSGIVGYGINQSSTVAPTYTSCSPTTSFATVFDNITSNGTYYVWLKDQVGNVTNTVINVNYIESIPVAKFSFSGSITNEMTGKSYTSTGTTYVAGKVGNAISIMDGQIEVPLTDLGINSSTNVVTTSFWFKWNGEDSIMPVGFRIYDAWITNGFFGFNTAQGDVYGINNPFTIGVYTHVVLIFSKGDYTLNSMYINGVKQILSQKQSLQSNVNTVFEGNLNISGWDSNDMYFYRGSSIDELKVYNKAISDSEAAKLANE